MTVGPALPGETQDDFIARVIAAAPPPSSDVMSRLRQLLPPTVAERQRYEAARLGRAS